MTMERRSEHKKSVDGLTRRAGRPENFFQDLDEKNSHFSVFWVAVVIILIITFITLILLAVYLKRGTNFKSIEDDKISENLVPFSERVSNIRGDGRAVMVFRGKEFAKATGSLESDFPLSDANFEIKKDSIYLKGNLRDSFIPWPVNLKILGAVANDKFRFIIAPDSLQNIIINGQNKEKIESTFDKNLNSTIAEKGMIAQEIQTADGYIELHVIKEVK